ncbi:hypothetical protein DOM21_05945 [Bacteriovorax stolpii]|uniref:Tail specific protease domain-containing protein n=1 Tax=Bacteriovorax stolpii TaxID=960 RepID=A0A2K9NU04_BACTC|nr:S41 family peptidase [Bacteriovorax stolpii]AUN99001.1 hypothetical protein C0V70_12995 [Bacteriovorax stolpii]QDK41003.1 hypothetical protein DOM21_05945 [Bacteriovorax stolpii]TDP55474.1 peptidase S41-like protein [Bacteriovorax stolpii]
MFKTSVLSVLLMTSALSAMPAQAGLLDLFKKPNIQSEAVKDVYSGVKFTYLDTEDRLLIVNSFLKTVELEYALLPLKAERVGLDFKKVKAEALAAEEAAGSITLSAADRKDPVLKDKIAELQAVANMEFLDRMQLLVAKFEDTHFGINEKISRPFIYNGIRLFRVQGKVVIGSIEPKFISMVQKLSGADLSGLRVGDEVLAIDGVSVEDKVNELKAYIAGSSDEFRDSQAVRSLTLRNFKYDKKNYINIRLKSAGFLKLPTFVNNPTSETLRPDARAFMKLFNIPSDTASIGITFDRATNKWTDSGLAFEGYSVRKIQGNIKGLTEYTDDGGSVGLRTGYYINKGKTYGYMQLMTFATKNFKTGNTTQTFLDAIRNFIIELKENELPLIFDLRSNGGGNGNFPSAVLSMLAEEGVVYPGATSGMRITHYMRQLQEPFMHQMVNAENENTILTGDEFNAMFEDAIDNRLDYSPMYASDPTPFDAKVKGFSNKIVALVTADCISACDKMSFLLKSSKRATIIGTHSNGTGAGYLSTSELDTEWTDPLRVLSSRVPNYLFGLPGNSFDINIFEADSVSKMCTENMPTQADVTYSNTMVDITRNNLGWLQKAAQVLEEK